MDLWLERSNSVGSGLELFWRMLCPTSVAPIRRHKEGSTFRV